MVCFDCGPGIGQKPAMGIVEKESSKSLPWVFGQQIQLVWLVYFGQEIWEKFLLGNEA